MDDGTVLFRKSGTEPNQPGKIPMKPIAIEDVKVLELGLGRSIYSPEQLEEFARFQESQGTRRAFLAESAERAYNTRVGDQWGSYLTWPLHIWLTQWDIT